MKLTQAIIKPFKLEGVRVALSDLGASGLPQPTRSKGSSSRSSR